jgi:hypothetical protein
VGPAQAVLLGVGRRQTRMQDGHYGAAIVGGRR